MAAGVNPGIRLTGSQGRKERPTTHMWFFLSSRTLLDNDEWPKYIQYIHIDNTHDNCTFNSTIPLHLSFLPTTPTTEQIKNHPLAKKRPF